MWMMHFLRYCVLISLFSCVKATIPRGKDSEADPYRAKWSDAHVGQLKHKGWEGAYVRFEELKTLITEWRAKDQTRMYEFQDFVKKQLRRHNNITAETPHEKKKRSRKRKSDAVTLAEATLLTIIDE